MKKYDRARFHCIEGVHVFGQKPEMQPLTPKESAFFANVETTYEGLKDFMVDQGTGNRSYREGAAERRRAVDAMWQMCRRITAIARSIAEEGVDPGMAEKFRLPHYNRTYLKVAATALGFAEQAEPIAALFTERGMEATFVADLRAKAAAFETASGTRLNGLSVQTTGTAGLELLAKQGLKFVRLLRPLITEKLKNNPALLASWKLVSRVASTGAVAAPGRGGEQTPGTGSEILREGSRIETGGEMHGSAGSSPQDAKPPEKPPGFEEVLKNPELLRSVTDFFTRREGTRVGARNSRENCYPCKSPADRAPTPMGDGWKKDPVFSTSDAVLALNQLSSGL